MTELTDDQVKRIIEVLKAVKYHGLKTVNEQHELALDVLMPTISRDEPYRAIHIESAQRRAEQVIGEARALLKELGYEWPNDGNNLWVDNQ